MLKLSPVQSILGILFASVLEYFVLIDPRSADQVHCEYLILPQSGGVLC